MLIRVFHFFNTLFFLISVNCVIPTSIPSILSFHRAYVEATMMIMMIRQSSSLLSFSPTEQTKLLLYSIRVSKYWKCCVYNTIALYLLMKLRSNKNNRSRFYRYDDVHILIHVMLSLFFYPE